MSLVAKHGEEAAAVLVKHPAVGEGVIEKLGPPAVRISALEGLGPQNGRRLAMMAESGELAKIGRTPELLSVMEKYGNPACDFVWRNKGTLSLTVAAGAFLADPEPFISGAKDITAVVSGRTLSSRSRKCRRRWLREAAGEVARDTNWTWVVQPRGVGLCGFGLAGRMCI